MGAGYDGTHIPTVTITGAGSSCGCHGSLFCMALKSVTVSSGGTVLTGAFLMTDGGTVVTSLNGESTTFKTRVCFRGYFWGVLLRLLSLKMKDLGSSRFLRSAT